MKVFWDPAQLARAPHFFPQRGQVRSKHEIPARAGAAIGRLTAPAAFIQESGYGTDTLAPLLQAFLAAFSG